MPQLLPYLSAMMIADEREQQLALASRIRRFILNGTKIANYNRDRKSPKRALQHARFPPVSQLIAA